MISSDKSKAAEKSQDEITFLSRIESYDKKVLKNIALKRSTKAEVKANGRGNLEVKNYFINFSDEEELHGDPSIQRDHP